MRLVVFAAVMFLVAGGVVVWLPVLAAVCAVEGALALSWAVLLVRVTDGRS